jgi:hypothetical protein
LQGLLAAGVAKGNEPNHINILLQSTPKSLSDEGDFGPVEMMMSLVVAADLIAKPEDAKKKPASPFERLVSIYSSMGESLQNS